MKTINAKNRHNIMFLRKEIVNGILLIILAFILLGIDYSLNRNNDEIHVDTEIMEIQYLLRLHADE